MAIGKKKAGTTTRRRKPGASKPAKRKKASVKGEDSTTIGGKKFTKTSCHSTKTEAKKKADKVRASGLTARVVKDGKKTCVLTGPKRKRA
jgi:hypothetical protein